MMILLKQLVGARIVQTLAKSSVQQIENTGLTKQITQG